MSVMFWKIVMDQHAFFPWRRAVQHVAVLTIEFCSVPYFPEVVRPCCHQMKWLCVTVAAYATELPTDTWGNVDVRRLVHPLTLASAKPIHIDDLHGIPERDWATAQQVPLSRPYTTVCARSLNSITKV